MKNITIDDKRKKSTISDHNIITGELILNYDTDRETKANITIFFVTFLVIFVVTNL